MYYLEEFLKDLDELSKASVEKFRKKLMAELLKKSMQAEGIIKESLEKSFTHSGFAFASRGKKIGNLTKVNF